MIENAVTDIEHRINELDALKSELTAARRLVAKCKGCGNQPSSTGCPHCPINKSLEKIQVLNLLWE
jgi:hypothetical protein